MKLLAFIFEQSSYNEHLINEGDVLYEQLAKFYTDMYNNNISHHRLKLVFIITLQKVVGN